VNAGPATFEPTWESVRTHRVPGWYEDAKLGVFLHWGLYSVPGWAPQVPDIQELLTRRGPKRMLRENPYAEWYLNSMQIPGSPTQRHHGRVYGADFPYDDFVTAFDDAASGARLDAMASVCQEAGARYVVLTTKHHDGFALWPSQVPHPVKGTYHSRRDLVGELGDAVRSHGMRMGLYYSGGYDWPYNAAVIRRASDVILAAPDDDTYSEYVTAHVLELIERYQPSVLWNDISWPRPGNLAELFARYYNTVADGVVNDRWLQPKPVRGAAARTLVRLGGDLVQLLWPLIPARRKRLTFGAPRHFDFRTPEYQLPDNVTERKWELARGVGHSFGANRHERPEDIITDTELIRMLCDVVSKNGNLLIGVGPRPDGTIPESQRAPLRGLGAWLSVNGEAVYGSRPWVMAASATMEGTPVRFTSRGDHVYAMILGAPHSRRISMPELDGSEVTRVGLVGLAEPLEWGIDDGELSVVLPQGFEDAAVTTLDLSPGVRPRWSPGG
jgi:alpha-L-fucosidase